MTTRHTASTGQSLVDVQSTRTGPDAATKQSVVLVLGGTGMLLPAVEDLVQWGEAVVVVARHARRAVAAMPVAAAGVDADWSSPRDYIEACTQAVAGRTVRGLLMWVHQPHRDAITRGLDNLVSAQTRIVRLWGSGGGNPRAKAALAAVPSTGDLCDVYLGSTATQGVRSWLTHEQICEGALTALAGTCRELVVGDLLAP